MVEKKVNLRHAFRDAGAGKDPIPNAPTPKPIEVSAPGIEGTLPFSAGVINPTSKTPKGVMAEGEMVANAPLVTPEAELRKVIKPKAPVNIDDLPEAQFQETMAGIQSVMNANVDTEFIPRGPGIAEARAKAIKAAAETKARLQPKPQPKPQAPPATPEPAPAKEEEVKNEPIQPATRMICAHCGWPIDSMDNCAPTRSDKQIFVAAVLGQKRFIKEYDLLGGQMRISFRSLTVAENDLVIKQMIQDWNDGKISGPAHSVAEATKYQLALALNYVETHSGPLVLHVLDEYDYDEPEKGTILPDIVEYVYSTAIPNEPIRRIVAKAYSHFVETVSKLEAMAETADFWKATVD